VQPTAAETSIEARVSFSKFIVT